MEFINFDTLQKSKKIDLFFPDWKSGEAVAFLSPHDDDVILGAGYLLKATLENNGTPVLFIFCSGDAGYSTAAEKATIVERRKAETFEAYGKLGIKKEDIIFFDIPDFSLGTYINRKLPQGSGLFEEQVRLFREKKITRIVFSSGHYEHWDHSAVFDMGIYTSPQAGDPILADLGGPQNIKSFFIYSVWGDFTPEKSETDKIRADRGILVENDTERNIRDSIQSFDSQKKIFQEIVAYREKRKTEFGYLELYKSANVRKQVDFNAYFELLKHLEDK